MHLQIVNNLIFCFLVTDLYPSHGHGHSTSPNLPLTSHNISHNPYPSHSIYPTSTMSNIMPLSQTMTPPTSLSSGGGQPSGSPVGTLSSIGGSIQNLSHGNYKVENENNNGVGNSSSPGVQHNSVYSSNMPPTPTSMVTILGPTSGKGLSIFYDNDRCSINTSRYITQHLADIIWNTKSITKMTIAILTILLLCFTANSNSNETPCANDSTNNNIQHLSSQWGISSASQINRNASPTGQTLPTTISQLGQPLGVHSQSLTSFGQNGLHNSSLHGYPAHNPSKGFGHQPFYGWY